MSREEVKQSRVHLDIAQRIADKLADTKTEVSQEAALQVLKPLLTHHIAPAMLTEMPEDLFTTEKIQKNHLINKLSEYLQKIQFTESEAFFKDLDEKHNQFKTRINNKI
jgi:hypothetical protein